VQINGSGQGIGRLPPSPPKPRSIIMNKPQANVLIHVDHPCRGDALAFMHNMLVQVDGVAGVSPSARPQLVQVNYDPDRTRGRVILDHVRQFGLSAQLVGL
jgi:hypothetical protein